MMEMFIRIENGQPVDHPIMGDNFRRAFPYIDPSNPSPDFAKFVRVPKESVSKDKVIIGGPTYQWVDGVVQDVWETRDLTPEELLDMQLSVEFNNG